MPRPPRPSDPSLPIPDARDVAGFVELYRREYGVELDDVRAAEILGGLMRWAWMTRERPDEEPAGVAACEDQNGPDKDTQPPPP